MLNINVKNRYKFLVAASVMLIEYLAVLHEQLLLHVLVAMSINVIYVYQGVIVTV